MPEGVNAGVVSWVGGVEPVDLKNVVAMRCLRVVLANFELTPAGKSRQIDFVVITEQRAELIELKNLTAPVRGGFNGSWRIETSPGFFVPYPGPNPWEEAKGAKLALSDAIHDYAKRRPDVPKPMGGRYFRQFDASVTIYPALVPGSQVCGGNYKAWIRSFADTLGALIARPFPVQPTWGIHDWRAFAPIILASYPRHSRKLSMSLCSGRINPSTSTQPDYGDPRPPRSCPRGTTNRLART